MKKTILWVLAAVLLFTLASCGTTPKPSSTPQSTEAATPAGSSATPASTPTAAPTPTPFGETPDSAGKNGILFDIYAQRANADLNLDGTAEQIEFAAGEDESTLVINGTAYPIGYAALAQCFAVTDIDTADDILEIALTDQYHELEDTEQAFTYLFWWDGTQLYDMGLVEGLMFDSFWRADLHPAAFFDGKGLVQYITRTTEFTDVWYMGHFICDGAERKLKEDFYASDPLYEPDPLTLRTYCVLLKEIDSEYFKDKYSEMWDYGGSYGTFGRNYSDEIVSFIPQKGETLNIVRVYGPYWFKLEASDGKTGWLKCVDGKIQGIYQVMGWESFDVFDGITFAG